ncbi:phosphatase PAP2 family protein [Cerasicoccus maritimus]|uniref:phosphatase PAP2 family protein n=1 Tax=Cerasicoccus maritimus TaxID=490089 RepID=UPI00285275CE|nr:phosphatase PAP2 family protein [Cerasicoccus maritimus]
MPFTATAYRRLGCILALSLAAGSNAETTYPDYAADSVELLMPFSQLLSTPDGVQALQDNLNTSFHIQNNATAAEQHQAIHDFVIDSDLGTTMATGLGSTYTNRYFAAIYAGDTTTLSGGTIYNALSSGIGYTGPGLDLSKQFFGTGDSGNLTINFPTDGQANIYQKAYIPTVTPDPNGEGDPRPFQVAPHLGRTIVEFSAPSFVIPVAGGTPPPVGPDFSNVTGEEYLVNSASFASGHTDFAYSSGLLFAIMVPEKYQDMLYRASEFGNGRIVMGHHYTLDVMGGRTNAMYSIAQYLQDEDNYNSLMQAATDFRSIIGAGDGTDIFSQGISGSELAEAREIYRYRMTYDLTPTHSTELEAVAPEASAILLETRFPYLTTQQRLDVLSTTMIESGAPLDNTDPEYAGWFRLNLFDAAGGYGSLQGDTTVVMDASQGGFHAKDLWNNDISGPGQLIKQGTGELHLSGGNTFAGVDVQAGKIVLSGSNLFTGASSVGGSGSEAKLGVSGFLGAQALTVGNLGTVNLAGGGSIMTEGDISIASTGRINILVSGNDMLEAGAGGSGSVAVDGDITLAVGPLMPAGLATPIKAQSGITGSKIIGVGGQWSASQSGLVVSDFTHLVLDSETKAGSLTGFDAGAQRLAVEQTAGESEFIISFGEPVGVIDITVMELSIGEIAGETVLGAYEIDSSLSGDFLGLLSFDVGAGVESVKIYGQLNDSSPWTAYDPDLAEYLDGWVSFDIDRFASYAVTGVVVPEPSTYALVLGGLCLGSVVFRRLRRG